MNRALFKRRRRWGLVVGLLAIGLCLVALLLGLTLQAQPMLAPRAELNAEDVGNAVQLLRANDPRRAQSGRVQALSLAQRDLELLLNHGGRRWADGAATIKIERGQAVVKMSLDVRRWVAPPLVPVFTWVPGLGPWLNIEVRLLQAASLPALDGLSVGRLPLPLFVAQPLALRALSWVGLADELPLLAELVQHVRFTPEQMRLVYAWQSGMGERMLAALVSGDEKRRLAAHAQHLAELLRREQPARQVSMAQLMGPLLDFSRQRVARGGDAVQENRAAIMVLALYLNGRNLKTVLPAGTIVALRPMRVTLSGRDDWPLHFIVSAALSAEGSTPLSQAIGLFKEVADAKGGSGFSFNDMAANRAGTLFGELAVKNPTALLTAVARAQAAHGGVLIESDFMPLATDLPEYMPEAEFQRRYGGVGAPAYLEQMAEIERRVATLPVLASARTAAVRERS
jgi:Trp operon repressor